MPSCAGRRNSIGKTELMKKKSPRSPAGSYYSRLRLVSSRRQVLVGRQVVDVLKPRRTRRQLSRIQEVRVERVVACRRRVNVRVAVNPVAVSRVEHAHERSAVVGCYVAPVLQISDEVVNTTIGTSIARCPIPAGRMACSCQTRSPPGNKSRPRVAYCRNTAWIVSSELRSSN